MLAMARLTVQTIGAILAGISFRIAGDSETVALAAAATLTPAHAQALAARRTLSTSN
jgi:hypothetical protein